MPAATNPNPNRAAMEALSGVSAVDWEGNEVEEGDGYDAYLASMPPKADLRPYTEPVAYWEVRYPGCTLQPYPRMGSFSSTDEGMWYVRNAAQERAVREHLAIAILPAETPTSVDALKVSDAEWAVIRGKQKGDVRYCQTGGCLFQTTSMHAATLHEELTQHQTNSKPKVRRA